ncbi:hypothetical protein [Aquincola tertiaricarbonis]|uniref:hypothetical protein n=1 Tax=Aquincola tertiaricarbonis TaxID=391953 RepID=UPI0006150E8E|nr:hypothetical protein [Aquincola tertiaricarbonis]
MKNNGLGGLAYALLGAFLGALVCLAMSWTLGKADAFASFPLYGSVGATVLGLIGLAREENERAARKDDP